MATEDEITQQERKIADLEKHLDDTSRYKDKIELDRIDISKGLQMLTENMKFLKRRGVISLMDEYAKISKSIKALKKDLQTLDVQYRQLQGIVQSQQLFLNKQKETLLRMKTAEEKKVLKFERKKT